MNDTNVTDTKKFELKSKSIFCTYPRCDLDKEFVLTFFKNKGFTKIVVSKELHKDGYPHLHVYASSPRAKHFRERTLDLDEFHPNIQSCKNYFAVLAYIKKDKDFIEYGMDTQAYENAKKNKKSIIANECFLGNKTAVQVVEENPEYGFKFCELEKNILAFKNAKKTEDNKKRFVEENYPKQKKRHFWIWGSTNAGKSCLKEALLEYNEDDYYILPPDNKWEDYSGQHYIIADEFKGDITIQELNRICDGNNFMPCRFVKKQLVPRTQVYVFSNFHPDDCYSKASRNITDTLKSRFNIMPFNFKDLPGYDEEIHNDENRCPVDITEIFNLDNFKN